MDVLSALENEGVFNPEDRTENANLGLFQKFLQSSSDLKTAASRLNQSISTRESERMFNDLKNRLIEIFSGLPQDELAKLNPETKEGSVFRFSLSKYHVYLHLTIGSEMRGFHGQIDTSYITVRYYFNMLVGHTGGSNSSRNMEFVISVNDDLDYAWRRDGNLYSTGEVADIIFIEILQQMIQENEHQINQLRKGPTRLVVF